jgi:hypothetical protein
VSSNVLTDLLKSDDRTISPLVPIHSGTPPSCVACRRGSAKCLPRVPKPSTAGLERCLVMNALV